jgi:hypothetical protein
MRCSADGCHAERSEASRRLRARIRGSSPPTRNDSVQADGTVISPLHNDRIRATAQGQWHNRDMFAIIARRNGYGPSVPQARIGQLLHSCEVETGGMFRMLRPNLIESTEGFSVEILGRVGMRYTEWGKSVRIESEVLATPEIAVDTDSILKWNDGSVIDDATRNRIIQNIRDAVRSQGEDIVVT